MNKLTVALVGNPNAGKTTVFNALTGAKQRVGNWPGVTVDRKTGHYVAAAREIFVEDLPGVYSLTASIGGASIDERIACEFILSREAELIVNVIDAANLERNLYLTMQLVEYQVPVVVALNMMDVATQRGMTINISALEKKLGCKVIPIQASKGRGIDALKAEINRLSGQPSLPHNLVYSPVLEKAISTLSCDVEKVHPGIGRWLSVRLLEDDFTAQQMVDATVLSAVKVQQARMMTALGEDGDILFADARYQHIATVLSAALQKSTAVARTVTQKIDHIVLNRFLGMPIFLGMLYLMFFFSINVGGAFQDFFDLSSQALFVQGISQCLTAWHLPDWFIAIVGVGVGTGLNTTVTFIPVIASMFLFLSFLENSGYMMRAAFVADRLMRALGLPGKSFVPMIVGFGCNVPAIMGARTLDNQRDRILTVLMAPFMSCGARLTIYAVFVSVFFQQYGALVVLSLYLVGILLAVLTGLLLRKTLLQGEPSPLVMELPPYHLPTGKAMLLQTWQRLRGFIVKAGRFILPVCVLISALNAINLQGQIIHKNQSSDSVLSLLGRQVTPLFSPMGISEDNWPATVGLLTGMLAKEVVIGTLNTLYADRAQLSVVQQDISVMQGLQIAWQTIPDNFGALGDALINPIASGAVDVTVTQGVLGELYHYFNGRASAYAYLLFVLLYVPCITTIAAIHRELGRGWAAFSIAWNTCVAYGVAVMFYQGSQFISQPLTSLLWFAGLLAVFLLLLLALHKKGVKNKFLLFSSEVA